MKEKIYGYRIQHSPAGGVYEAISPAGESVVLYEWTPPAEDLDTAKQSLAAIVDQDLCEGFSADGNLYIVARSPEDGEHWLGFLRSRGLFVQKPSTPPPPDPTRQLAGPSYEPPAPPSSRASPPDSTPHVPPGPSQPTAAPLARSRNLAGRQRPPVARPAALQPLQPDEVRRPARHQPAVLKTKPEPAPPDIIESEYISVPKRAIAPKKKDESKMGCLGCLGLLLIIPAGLLVLLVIFAVLKAIF